MRLGAASDLSTRTSDGGREAQGSSCPGIGAEPLTRPHKLKDLGIANKHLVAIARALSDRRPRRHHGRTHCGAQPKGDRGALRTGRRSSKRQGKAILFISHKFDEIFRIADNLQRVIGTASLWAKARISDVSKPDALVKTDGGPRRQIISFQHETRSQSSATRNPGGFEGYEHPTEFADIGFHPSPRRDPWLLRPSRGRAGRNLCKRCLGSPGPVRRHRADRQGKAGDYPFPSRRRCTAVLSTCPEDRGKQGAIVAHADLSEHHTAIAGERTSRKAVSSGLPRSSSWPANIASVSICRAASLDTPGRAACRAATNRRW